MRLFDLDTVLAKMRSLVGFEDTTAIPLPDSLTTTDSGLTFNKFDALLTPKNLQKYTPDSDNDEAVAATRLANMLASIRDAGIIDALYSFYDNRIAKGGAAQVMQSRPAFTASGSGRTLSMQGSYYAGWRMVLSPDMNNVVKIKRLGFTGTEPGTIKVHLHNFDIGEVTTQDLIYTGSYTQQWFDCEFELKGFDASTGLNGGVWFLYLDLTEYAGTPINRNYNWLNACGSCGITYEYTTLNILGKNAVGLAPAVMQKNATFDTPNLSMTTDNFGLNMDIWAGCDYTQFLLDNADLFASVIQKNVGVKLLDYMLTNPEALVGRAQGNLSKQEDRLQIKLYGDATGKVKGLVREVAEATEALDISLDGLSEICFKRPRGNRIRVDYR